MSTHERQHGAGDGVDELARKLVEAGRYREAGDMLLDSVGGLAGLASLSSTLRKRAQKSVICFTNCGDVQRAAEVLVGMGEIERAVQLLENTGHTAEAAKLQAQSTAGSSMRARTPATPRVSPPTPGPVRFPLSQPASANAPTELMWQSQRSSASRPGQAAAPSAGDPPSPVTTPPTAVVPTPPAVVPAAGSVPVVQAAAPMAPPAVTPAPAPVTPPPVTPAPAQVPQTAAAPLDGSESLSPGKVVSSRFRLERALGQGGTAFVFQATDMELKETVAIKFIRREIADEQLFERFKAEVTLSRRLNHPNIIRLYDLGSHELGEQRSLKYITMELLDGADLDRVLGTIPLDIKLGVDLLTQACTGLQAVHEAGVIHRDVKPENLFVTKDGVLKVMDFGLAKRRQVPGLTVGGIIAGTPDYMSPEQIKEFSKVTHLADIYSLGCIAYRMFAGRLPFQHEEVAAKLVSHLMDTPESPRKHNPRLPSQMERLILDMLSKKPSMRPGSCREIVERLRDFRA